MTLSFKYGVFAFTKRDSHTCVLGKNETQDIAEEGNGFVQKKNANIENVVIPSYVTYNGRSYKVIETNRYCFRLCTFIKYITLPDTLEIIGFDSFYQINVENLVIPSSVKYISKAGLSNLMQCKSLTFQPGSQVSSLPEGSMARLEQVQEIIIPPSVVDIQNAFKNVISYQNKTMYYCGTSDLSTATLSQYIHWTIYVTSNYPSKTMGNVEVKIDEI